ncbi:MAG: PilZ domain-containing protein [Candidatus Omnitrophica bacterium]|nr:PilZ domain-containing protein [Candidatus Omnitrophota bacterium]
MMNYEDKRKTKRFNCLVPVDGKEGSPFSSTKTVDISRDGIGFVSSRSVPLYEKIAIELALRPDAEPVLVIGEVKWVRKVSDADQYRIGLTFSDIIDGSKNDLDESLSSRFARRESI